MVGAVVQLLECRTRNQDVAGSTHTQTTASKLEQVANLLCAQANSASYPQQDGKWVVAMATGWGVNTPLCWYKKDTLVPRHFATTEVSLYLSGTELSDIRKVCDVPLVTGDIVPPRETDVNLNSVVRRF